MQSPYIGSILCVAFNRVPDGWLPCEGGQYPVTQYSALYAVIGVNYGGTPNFNFAVPDLRSRVPRGPDSQNPIATRGGVESVQLSPEQLASHNHNVQVNSATASATAIAGNLLAAGSPRGVAVYAPPGTVSKLDPTSISEEGGSDSHTNLQPYLPIRFLIAHSGTLPDQPLPESDPYIGELRVFPWGVVPGNWAPCNGQSLSIKGNDILFGLIGNAFGGDGVNNFNLPDLRGRVPMGAGQGPGLANYPIGQQGGQEGVNLTVSQMPKHSHQPLATAAAPSATNPSGNMLAAGAQIFANGPQNAILHSNTVANTGVGAAHENMMPFLTLNICICLRGIYPKWS